MAQKLLWICLGGALGTGTRYLIGVWSTARFGSAFPYGTLIVNVLGCFLIALIMQIALTIAAFPATLRLALTTGFMGGLTTYSSFAYETASLLRGGSTAIAFGNFLLTTVACFAAVALGGALARMVTG